MDAPRADYCGDDTVGGFCTLLGHYRDEYEWYKFESDKKKFQANRELLDEADYRRLNYFKGGQNCIYFYIFSKLFLFYEYMLN